MPASDNFVDLHFPLAGLDTSSPYDRQPNRPGADGDYARTTPKAVNVRGFEPLTGRARGGSRPGQSKFSDLQVNGDNSIQDLTAITLAKPSFALPGTAIAPGSASSKAVILAAGGTVAFTTGTLNGPTIFSAFDANYDAYLGTMSSGGAHPLQITKIDLTFVEQSYQTTPYNGGATAVISGLAVFDTTVYALVHVTGNSYVFRVDAADGTALDPGPWLSVSDVVVSKLAVTAGAVALFGVLSGAALLRQYDRTTGALVAETTVDTDHGGTHLMLALCPDDQGNLYASAGQDDGGGTIHEMLAKVNPDGAVLWTRSGANVSGSEAWPVGLAYDVKNRRLAAVGTKLFLTASDSFQSLNPDTGATIAGSNPGAAGTWNAVAADGLGGFRLGRLATTANVVGLAEDLSVAWTASTGVNASVVASTAVLDSGANRMRPTRVTRLLATAGGQLARVSRDAKRVLDANFLSPNAAVVFGQPIGLKVYYVDGHSYRFYNAATEATGTVVATAGALPVDNAGEACRLHCLWHGRWVKAGLRGDPQNYFMSKVDAPEDNDYSPLSTTPTQAFAGTNALTEGGAGLNSDIINTLIPWSDDILLMGGDHTIRMMTGDPMAGGQIQNVTDQVGMAFGKPWCKGPDGTLYFFANRGGVYYLVPGQVPVRLSQQISDQIEAVNTGTNFVRLEWDDHAQGLHVLISPFVVGSTTHYFWEQRTAAWFEVSFENPDHNALAVYLLDGDDPGDRVLLLGGRDGFIRHFDDAAATDDGFPIQSTVVIGPLLTKDMDMLMLYDLQAVLGAGSGLVRYDVLGARSAEEAIESVARRSGVLTAGRSTLQPVQVSAHALYVQLSSAVRWGMEEVRCRIASLGAITRRGLR